MIQPESIARILATGLDYDMSENVNAVLGKTGAVHTGASRASSSFLLDLADSGKFLISVRIIEEGK